jgi:two-component system, chemotaxis family, chemotaxis protein CheY
MKILITDDDFISRNLVYGILMPFAKCDVAEDGKQAVEAFEKAWEDKKPYDIICLDIEMPDMDGHETLKQIRGLEDQMAVTDKERARIIMITASRDPKSVMAARQSKAEAYLIKPIEKDRLLDEISRLKRP